jgi:hypothetical protein
MVHYGWRIDYMARTILGEDSPIISDPLAWQRAIEDAPASINLRGSERFWATVEALSGMEVVYRNGAPEFSEIVFRLKGNIGLRLFAKAVNRFEFDADDTDITPNIGFEFCEIVEG